MSKPLWGGRFSQAPSELFSDFNQSFSFDYRLLPYDITASIAYAKGLAKAGIITEHEQQQLIDGLTACCDLPFETGFEDVHSFVEAKLADKIGDVAYKLHSGRSRNDQVATDLRLYNRDQLTQLQQAVGQLQQQLIDLATPLVSTPLASYTHLQSAQPTTWGHYFHSFVAMFFRDQQRISHAYQQTNVLPLGSGACTGNSLGVDRAYLAECLGFSALTTNSLDAVSDRDFVAQSLFALSLLLTHCSKLAEDLIIFNSNEFNFITLGDAITTGSSLMPQKKNPDGLELIRGKVGRVNGHLLGLLTTLKALPSTYNKDLQEDKVGLFDAHQTALNCVQVLTLILSELTVNPEQAKRSCANGFIFATELADYLVKKHLPFRKAHHLVGEIVQYCEQQHIDLSQLTLAQLQSFSELFAADCLACLTLEQALAAKDCPGGTAPNQVRQALAAAQAQLDQLRQADD